MAGIRLSKDCYERQIAALEAENARLHEKLQGAGIDINALKVKLEAWRELRGIVSSLQLGRCKVLINVSEEKTLDKLKDLEEI
jgi:hypothetical protein